MLRVDIIENADAVHTRTTTVQTTGEIKNYFNQFGYAYLGDAFPVKIKLPIESPQTKYPVGQYKLALSSFQVGRFDSLEVNNFQIKLEPMGNK